MKKRSIELGNFSLFRADLLQQLFLKELQFTFLKKNKIILNKINCKLVKVNSKSVMIKKTRL